MAHLEHRFGQSLGEDHRQRRRLQSKDRVFIAPRGTTAQRPNPAEAGTVYYDTTIAKLISFNGTVWKDGTDATV